MALLTIPSGLVKGTAFTVSLDKTTLLALPSVSANAHFSNPSKIAKCVVKYVGAVSGALINQTHFMNFDLSQATPQHVSVLSSSAADLMSISQVLLVDHDGAVFAVPASEIPALTLSFISGGGGGGGSGTLTVVNNSFVPSPMPGYYDIHWDSSNPSYSSAYVVLFKEVGPGMYNLVTALGWYSFGAGSVNGSLLEAGASYVLRLASDGMLSPYSPLTQSATIASPVSGGGSGTLTVVNNSFYPHPMPGYYGISWDNSNPSYSNAYVALLKEVGPGMYDRVAVLQQYTFGAGSVSESVLEPGASYVLRLVSGGMGPDYDPLTQSATIASPVSGGGSGTLTVINNSFYPSSMPGFYDISWDNSNPSYSSAYVALLKEVGPGMYNQVAVLQQYSFGAGSVSQTQLESGASYVLRLVSDWMGMPYNPFTQSATIASPVSGGGSGGNTVNVTLSTYDPDSALFTINWEYLSGTGFMYLQYEAGPAIWETFGYLAPSSQGSAALYAPVNTMLQYRLAVSDNSAGLNATGAYSAPFSFQVNGGSQTYAVGTMMTQIMSSTNEVNIGWSYPSNLGYMWLQQQVQPGVWNSVAFLAPSNAYSLTSVLSVTVATEETHRLAVSTSPTEFIENGDYSAPFVFLDTDMIITASPSTYNTTTQQLDVYWQHGVGLAGQFVFFEIFDWASGSWASLGLGAIGSGHATINVSIAYPYNAFRLQTSGSAMSLDGTGVISPEFMLMVNT